MTNKLWVTETGTQQGKELIQSFGKWKHFSKEIVNFMNLGSRFYILPETQHLWTLSQGIVALTEMEVGNFLEIWCHVFSFNFFFSLNLMDDYWWLSKIPLEGNLTGLLILNLNSGSTVPNLNVPAIPEKYVTNSCLLKSLRELRFHSPGGEYFKVPLMSKQRFPIMLPSGISYMQCVWSMWHMPMAVMPTEHPRHKVCELHCCSKHILKVPCFREVSDFLHATDLYSTASYFYLALSSNKHITRTHSWFFERSRKKFCFYKKSNNMRK